MAWDRTPGTRRDLPKDWPQRVQRCKDAAGGRCEWILPSGRRCPRDGAEADHYGKSWEHHKLRWLCTTHHKQRTAKQALAARTRGGTPKRTKQERHPGQLRRPTGET